MMLKKKSWTMFLTMILILTLIITSIISIYQENKSSQLQYPSNETISIIAWNLQVFGDKKAGNSTLMDSYVSILSGHDIILLQEIRDSDGNAFSSLCARFENFSCILSSRAGRSTSKEQYGIIYRNSLILTNFTDYNPDALDRWERPPARAEFSDGNYSLSIYITHIKPEDATAEIEELELLIEMENSSSNILIIGDLNADCDYYDETNRDFRKGWNWIVRNSQDTTATNSNCAYDRIIINDDLYNEFISYKIDKSTTFEMSDHYPISLIIQNTEQHSTRQPFKRFILSLIDP